MWVGALGWVAGAWMLQQQARLPGAFSLLCLSFVLVLIAVVVFNQFTKCLFQSSQFAQFTKFSFFKPLSIGLLACILGFVWAALLAHVRLADALPVAWQQKDITLIGVVSDVPEMNERGVRFEFLVEKILTKNAQVPYHISLNYYFKNSQLNQESTFFNAGERWLLTAKLKRPHSTYNPQGFDFEAWALSENIRATGNVRAKKRLQKQSDLVWRPQYLVARVRQNIGEYIMRALAHQPNAGIIQALVVGETSQITAPQWQLLQKTGTNHLMSISGLHITMLSGLAFGLVQALWRRSARCVVRLPAQKAGILAGLLVGFLYATLAGWSVPTQRTVLMLAVFGWALVFGRNIGMVKALSLALIVVVFYDPWAVISPGFWLSFGAVALISFVVSQRHRQGHWLWQAGKVQWAVTLGLAPFLLAIFGQFSLISPLTNTFAIPVVSWLVVPLAIVGGILHMDFLLTFAHQCLAWTMQLLAWCAAFPWTQWQQVAPPIWALALACVGVLMTLAPRGFPLRWLGLVLFLPMLLPKNIDIAPGDIRVTVLDVGQGLAVLLQTQHHQLLYDTGPTYGLENDAAQKIILPYLRAAGVNQLSGMVVSHEDADHSGGLKTILNQIDSQFLLTSITPDSPLLNGFKMPKKTLMQRCLSGQHWQWDGVVFEILHPDNLEMNRKDNDLSCVLKVSAKSGSVLLTGDIEAASELTLLAQSDKLNSALLIAPHHGSKTSSSWAFIQAVAAQQIVFTNGYLNRFHHPHQEVLNRYAQTGARCYRSDNSGAMVFDFKQTQQNQKSIINDMPNSMFSATPNFSPSPQLWRLANPRYWHDIPAHIGQCS